MYTITVKRILFFVALGGIISTGALGQTTSRMEKPLLVVTTDSTQSSPKLVLFINGVPVTPDSLRINGHTCMPNGQPYYIDCPCQTTDAQGHVTTIIKKAKCQKFWDPETHQPCADVCESCYVVCK